MTQATKYPKLRTRQQITVRYREVQDTREYLKQLRAANDPRMPRFVKELIERQIAEQGQYLDALLFALNGVV